MNKITKFFNDTYISFINESKIIFSDFGILLVASMAILIYGILYSYSYSTEVLQKVPIVVIDNDNSKQSHDFLTALESSPNIIIKYNAADMAQAKELVLDQKAHGIIYVEKGFGSNILSNKTAYFATYSDASYFLAYKQFFMAVADVMFDLSENIKYKRYVMSGQSSHVAEFMSQPVDVNEQFLYNKSQGYGSFLMPAVLILIIQQTILIACGMVYGKAREHKSINKLLFDKDGNNYSAGAIVLGRSFYYLLSNLITWVVIIAIVYPLFHFPNNGNIWEVFTFVIPYILSSSFIGIFTSTFFRYKESSILYIFFSSILLLLLSGISWPHQGMPEIIVWFSYIFPSTSAINGFSRLETMGANMTHVTTQYYMLIALSVVFYIVATIRYSLVIKKYKLDCEN